MTFVPCFLFILLGAPYVERLRGNRDLAAALAGITAAVVGVIASLAVFFAIHTLFGETGRVTAGPLDLEHPRLASIDWAALAARRTTGEQVRPGWNVRWYASSVELGHGRVTGPDTLTDREPNYLGRVQPYSVYVPASYRPATRAPLTWLLHSLTQNHNQYAATTPRFVW